MGLLLLCMALAGGLILFTRGCTAGTVTAVTFNYVTLCNNSAADCSASVRTPLLLISMIMTPRPLEESPAAGGPIDDALSFTIPEVNIQDGSTLKIPPISVDVTRKTRLVVAARPFRVHAHSSNILCNVETLFVRGRDCLAGFPHPLCTEGSHIVCCRSPEQPARGGSYCYRRHCGLNASMAMYEVLYQESYVEHEVAINVVQHTTTSGGIVAQSSLKLRSPLYPTTYNVSLHGVPMTVSATLRVDYSLAAFVLGALAKEFVLLLPADTFPDADVVHGGSSSSIVWPSHVFLLHRADVVTVGSRFGMTFAEWSSQVSQLDQVRSGLHLCNLPQNFITRTDDLLTLGVALDDDDEDDDGRDQFGVLRRLADPATTGGPVTNGTAALRDRYLLADYLAAHKLLRRSGSYRGIHGDLSCCNSQGSFELSTQSGAVHDDVPSDIVLEISGFALQ